MPDVPARIGRYLVIERIGHGGMGVVLEAFDPELDRRVALKLLHPERARGASRLRLLREAQALARLSHPNVVQVYDVGVSGGLVFMAMELVRGQTISQWLGERTRAWPEIVERFAAAGEGLRAAHAVGLVHRDFKPHNVLLGDDGRVRVADFGLASAEEATALAEPDGPSTHSYLATSLTSTGAVLGTPRYMAPEQHAGLEVGPAADQFAFCVALHEALFGVHPFEGSSRLALATNVIEGQLAEPRNASTVPRWLYAAIRRGLAPAPEDRHPSIDRLLRILEQEPLRRRRRWRAGVLSLALAVGAGGTTLLGLAGNAPCTGGSAAIAEVWSDASRDAMTIKATNPEEAATAEVVVRALDDYAEAWSESHRAVCIEHRDEAMSSEVFDSAMGCLHRGRAALQGVVETAIDGEPGSLPAVAGAAAGLPMPSHCRDRARLALDLDAPPDPTTAAAIASLRERLARAEAVHDAGALSAAIDELSAIEDEVAVLGHAPLEAERALIAGRLAIVRSDWPLAQRELMRALEQALGSRADVIAAEAMVRTVFVDAVMDGPSGVDIRDEAMAHALLERVHSPAELAALLANNVGVVRALSGDRERALHSFQAALAIADEAGDVDPVEHAAYLQNLARQTMDPDARDALFERGRALAERWLGPAHEKTLELAMLRALHTIDPTTATERMTPVCEIMASRPSAQWPRCLCKWRLAELHELIGAESAAKNALEQATHCLDRARATTGDPSFLDLHAAKIAAHASLLDADHQRALDDLDRAERGLQPHAELPWIAVDLADVALLRARVLHALQRGPEAIDGLRAAIATYDEEIAKSEDRTLYRRRDRATQLLATLEAQRRSSIP
ncbi:serine/threonine protein kinase [Paraliomyxa miuraensis]|nr:serine/threonine protein kinase [Paraliomyxa miuraensis]